MEKLNLKFSNSNVDEIVLNIKSNPLAKQVISQLHLTDEEIKNNYELINNFLSNNKSCINCSGMKNCNHFTKGHRYGIKRDDDNDLTDYFTICDYYKDYYVRKNNLIYTTFNQDNILDESQKRFILDNPQLLGLEYIKKIIQIQNNDNVSGVYLKVSNSKIRLKIIQSLAYNLLLNHKVSIVKFSDLLKNIKSEFKTSGNETYNLLLDSEILIVDGLGNEAITSWSRDEILLSILDNRLQNDKVTILCSEFSIEDLRKIYKIGYNDDVKANQLVEKIKDINS